MNLSTYKGNSFFAGLLAGFFLFLIIAMLFYTKVNKHQENCQSDFKFINPEPGCEISEKKLLENLQGIQYDVERQIEIAKSEKKAEKVSVYFRGLLSKRWFGINEKEDYSIASLFKLPVTIAYFKLSEYDSSILQKNVEYNVGNSFNDLMNIKAAKVLQPGKVYSIEELIEHMLIYSDNDAAYMLNNLIDKKYLEKVFFDLDIHLPMEDGTYRDQVTAQKYSAILRSLYNASYLSRENSDKVLEILSNAQFKDGLVAGVPNNVVVSHKFGEIVRENAFTPVSLHDCGIIYKKNRPYILCVMTQGNNLDDLKAVIGNISKIVYDGVTW